MHLTHGFYYAMCHVPCSCMAHMDLLSHVSSTSSLLLLLGHLALMMPVSLWYGPCHHAMCRPTPIISKNVKFRPSWNSTKIVWITRFCKTNSTLWYVSSSEIREISRFTTCTVTVIDHFAKYFKFTRVFTYSNHVYLENRTFRSNFEPKIFCNLL